MDRVATGPTPEALEPVIPVIEPDNGKTRAFIFMEHAVS
jgi:hypothetical protein